MKAEITEDGTLTLTPENGTESYAIKQWLGENDHKKIASYYLNSLEKREEGEN